MQNKSTPNFFHGSLQRLNCTRIMNRLQFSAPYCWLALFLTIAYVPPVHSSQVWQIELQDINQLHWLRQEESRLSLKHDLDFWRSPSSTHKSADVMVPRSFHSEFNDILKKRNITYSVLIDDVEALIVQQRDAMKERQNATCPCEFDYSVYHPIEEISQWVKDFAEKHKDIVEVIQIGKSYQRRKITGLKISTGTRTCGKRSVWFEGGIHAREWISPATVMYITNQLVTDYKKNDTTVKKILDNLDFYIVPSLNVDGYAYTWTKDRLWRKTRSRNRGSLCVGTDPNRNWPFKWGGEGASSFSCSNTYRGAEALSEVEMKSVTDYALARAKEQPFMVFIDWHSYSQLWLAPWAYSEDAVQPKDAKDQATLGNLAVQAIKTVNRKKYTYGPTAETLYEASGSSNDWGYASLGAKYSYVVELRDTGKYGFLLPEYEIVPTGEEAYAAVKVVGDYVVDEMINELNMNC